MKATLVYAATRNEQTDHHFYRVYILVPFRKHQGLCAGLPVGLLEKNIFVLLTQIAKHHVKKLSN